MSIEYTIHSKVDITPQIISEIERVWQLTHEYHKMRNIDQESGFAHISDKGLELITTYYSKSSIYIAFRSNSRTERELMINSVVQILQQFGSTDVRVEEL